jgi:hypothetical protein
MPDCTPPQILIKTPFIIITILSFVLIVRRLHSSILDVRSFRGAECDTDQYLVVAKVRERLAVLKRAAQKIDTEGDVTEQY